jgi:hypothetical protein
MCLDEKILNILWELVEQIRMNIMKIKHSKKFIKHCNQCFYWFFSFQMTKISFKVTQSLTIIIHTKSHNNIIAFYVP